MFYLNDIFRFNQLIVIKVSILINTNSIYKYKMYSIQLFLLYYYK